VKDTGIGIPAERQPYLFNSFTQVDGSTTRKFGGTGLGLAISKQLAEMMGGQIGLASEPGMGTEFWFTVVLERQSGVGAETPAFPNLSVLVVERSGIHRQAMAQALEQAGCHFATAEDLPSVENHLIQRAATGEPFALVLLGDHGGPADPAFIPRIRANPNLAGTRFLRLAPFGNLANQDELTAAHFVGQLNLPFRFAQLVDCFAQALQLKTRSAFPPARKFSGALTAKLRILVVDDNNTNLIVITKILEKLGQKPVPVVGGAEAIAALLRPDFDLVLMDCQMPEMDGFETTRRIREGEAGAHSRTIPIVALTANVLDADQHKCLAAGMNGHLGKPIQIEELKAVLERWHKSDRVPETADASAITEPNAFLDGDLGSTTGRLVFNREDMLTRMLDDMEMATLTAQAFIEDLPKQLGAIKNAVHSGDPAATVSAAHRLKGAAGMIGGDALHHLLSELERIGKEQCMDAAAELIVKIDREAAALVRALQKEILSLPPDPFGAPFPAEAI